MNYIIYSRTFIIIFIACCSEIPKQQTISSIDASYTFHAVINSSNSLFAVTGQIPTVVNLSPKAFKIKVYGLFYSVKNTTIFKNHLTYFLKSEVASRPID